MARQLRGGGEERVGNCHLWGKGVETEENVKKGRIDVGKALSISRRVNFVASREIRLEVVSPSTSRLIS